MDERLVLHFKGMTKKQYSYAIFFIVFSIFFVAGLFAAIAIYYSLYNITRAQVILTCGTGGIITFFILAFLFKKLLADKFELDFKQHQVVIKSDKINEVIEYSHLRELEIRNNTDYSYLLFTDNKDKKVKIFVGMANLLSSKSIILVPSDKLDILFKENHFRKETYIKKGMEYIIYSS